ncbi:hypothetical protein EYF80_055487 [Liparis tanakae]|uniref:Secreted protein n=1 Tax=Liparis tanakae TaxID=230148 RepID=A0A4Z2EZR6_9TELE|nr:hypothetical protein EYF80_055487 [Liparis tanakae]
MKTTMKTMMTFIFSSAHTLLTLTSVSSSVLHTSFLSAVMSDFFSSTRYRLKKSGKETRKGDEERRRGKETRTHEKASLKSLGLMQRT